ncbi:DUF1538 domain-containing protein [Pseudarthrobacter sp. J64]|uniref:DUF1538 domain-containing protein n=1 Tax=unclassified Pseudarthrobacter TaxID=2647000 RepID=UPI002E7FBED6|nr:MULTISPECIES: DUF1538 domain-containing protein [unclassified Pseudarthrobacter]MEE2524464.1 DUF1538 domain-containing protein [Pseudarthrobacter sp. J47]MEE2569538.1 DUF1538 domain-containing protein [Pseudarthrobacter sp. J64]
MEHLSRFTAEFFKALRNLLPIVVVVVVFQAFVFRSMPQDPLALVAGLLIVAVGIALFLQGLDLSIFPVGKNLSNQFVRRGALKLLLPFGFAIGFAASVAEPAVLAVAEQAQHVSGGRIDSVGLRFVIAASVGLVMVAGILRVLRGWAVHRILIGGYAVVLGLTYVAPPEIVGLSYDSGGVTTNIVSVPLIAAIGLGLANSIRGRSLLADGFGLVALCVMVPMIGVQLYGIWVYNFGGGAAVLPVGESGEDPTDWVAGMIFGLAGMIREVLPIVGVVLFFQFVALRRRLAHPLRVGVGFVLVLVGLYAFVVGLRLGLFPLGTLMAEQLIRQANPVLILLFAFLIGFAVTMAEPALVAIGEQAQDAAPGRISASALRIIVALGVALGIAFGAFRILIGGPFHYFIMVAYAVAIVLVFCTPKYIVALAFDLGGVTTSEVTVPLVTALGIGLAATVEGRDVLIDGFGLIAFASIFPVIAVMVYAMVMEGFPRLRKEAP